jgi:hypothetical protein
VLGAIALATIITIASAGPAAADPAKPTVYRSDVERIEPEVEGVRLTLAIEQTGLLVPILKLFYTKTILQYLDMESKGFKARAESTE